jgi:polyisoprenoid-binding protein YceI
MRAMALRRPRSRRGWLLVLGGVLVVAVAAFAVAYFLLFPTSSPKRFSLTDTTPAATTSTARGSTASDGGSGQWKVASGSQAGYRVREKLAFLSAKSDAVGRTSALSGAATLAKSGDVVTITAASFKADLSTLKSDRDMRDQRIHQIGLESDRYPTATFKLASPLKLPSTFSAGRVVHVTAAGDFTIHGTTKREKIPLEMRLSGSKLEATGALTFPWSEFNMTAPSVGGFVTVDDQATMEFDLHLQQSAG